MTTEEMSKKYGSAGSICFESWINMVEDIQRRQSRGESFDIDGAINAILDRIEEDKRRANKKISTFNKLIIVGVILVILTFVTVYVPSLRGNSELTTILVVSGILLIVIGVKSKNGQYGVFVAANDFVQQYLK